MFASKSLVLGTLGLLAVSALGQVPQVPEQPEKYQWLEDVWGKKSIEWVKAHNKRSETELKGDPRFSEYEKVATRILESPDRLPAPDFENGKIFNTWQDAKHVRGILRVTSQRDYVSANPHWKTVLDIDALAKRDKRDWVMDRNIPQFPGDKRILIGLSDGGEDAVTLREFDLNKGQFVKNGFVLPRSKQQAAWVNDNELLVATDWGKGTMTTSGYAFVIKSLKRGQPLSAANEIFRGKREDTFAWPSSVDDGMGHKLNLISRALDFFNTETYVILGNKPRLLGLPKKSNVVDVINGQFVFYIDEDWTPAGSKHRFAKGSVLSVDFAAMKRDPLHLKPKTVFEPSSKEFFQAALPTKHCLVLTTMLNVQGQAYVCRMGANGAWNKVRLSVPENSAVDILSANRSDDKFFLSVVNFLRPSSYFLGDGRTNKLDLVKSRKSQFNSSDLVSEQYWATSKDGTRVPYFIVHKRGIALDGSNPTHMTAYGGFSAPSTPYYDPIMGKLWLEKGGVFVLANIRGGSEFGPAWHEAGLKTHRQRIYDDFAAVANDLFERKITSPSKLGISGGSNGGLLMGVQMTQHPEMYNAISIEIPLLDMLRFEHIAAGSSWTGEYGTVANPDERKFLAYISPYNRLDPNANYPEPLIFTTTKDDRVGPVHARKFAARMEEFGKPFYYYEILEGGHSSGADLKQKATTDAVLYSYFARKLFDKN